jgi:3-hydroxybutyrate dehydrogenase
MSSTAAAGIARPTFVTSGHLSREPRLPGKVAIISGASRGFGQAIAVRFVEEGARVVLLARSSLAETMSQIYAIEGASREYVDAHTLCVSADIESEADCVAAAAATTAAFGPAIHVLVNNAALFVFHSVETATAADWDRSAAVNIKGHALLTKACLPGLKAARGASIVWQGSISAFLAQPDCATYATMKGAIVQLARNCAYDFAKYGIRSNSVCAGTIETPISADERKAHGWTYEQWEALKVRRRARARSRARVSPRTRAHAQVTPLPTSLSLAQVKDVMLGRVGHVREIANATLFFACEESSYCTAAHLMCDGGQTPCTVME